jgi:1-deoxyxylulose-5-phosphate synthase
VEYLRLEPFEKPLSRLALGTLGFSAVTRERDYALLDTWVEAGGNVIDTAHVYEDGEAERLVGSWLRDRPGMREQVVIVTKGAHPQAGRSRVTPADIEADLRDSIERLGGPVDLYLLHRDDPAVGVDELIDALDAHRRAGEIRAFGVSNWALARIEEANAYAAARGITGISCNSPHLSLAIQEEPPWPGCVSANDAGSRAWHARTGMPLLAWSAQAGGFFAGSEGESARVYQSAPNRERRTRAEALGARTGHTANAIALAWVLAQPFPVLAAVGPHSEEHLRASLEALAVTLERDEIAWLNLEM